MKSNTATTENESASATRSISQRALERVSASGKRSARSLKKKATRHVVLELHEAPTDSAELAKMLYDTIYHYNYLVCPHKSDTELGAMTENTIGGIVELAQTENDLYQWNDHRAYVINKINFYRKMIEYNQVDDHTVGYNPTKSRWSK
jgi:hypothetical protein